MDGNENLNMNTDDEDDGGGGRHLDDGLQRCLLPAHVADEAVTKQQRKTLIMDLINIVIIVITLRALWKGFHMPI